jgi:hypothetical protein
MTILLSFYGPKFKKQSKIRTEETLKLGYHQRPWEDADRLLGRIARHHAGVVDAEMLKVFFFAFFVFYDKYIKKIIKKLFAILWNIQ